MGSYQFANAAVALATLEALEKKDLFTLDLESMQQGLMEVRWPARFEVLQQDPVIILDGAHNPQGAEILREALKRSFPSRKIHLVVGIMHDKDIRGIFRRLLPIAETVIFTQPRYSRAADAESLQYVIPDPASAIEQSRRLAEPDDVICITGSLYFAGEVKEIFGEPSQL
jgi:dihydrofolate synthase/folylpolyglutamate synthase